MKKGYLYPRTRWSIDHVVLLYAHGASIEEIRRETGMSWKTVKKILLLVQFGGAGTRSHHKRTG